jgi:transcriptional regulator GlxA family with amidase domain
VIHIIIPDLTSVEHLWLFDLLESSGTVLQYSIDIICFEMLLPEASSQEIASLTVKTAANCRLKVSVCTGALLLGAAGFLKGRRATTHRTEFERLKEFCAAVVDERIVDEGDVITARGVTSSIDLGLYLCERLAGYEAKEKIRKQMDYCRAPRQPVKT